MERLSEKQPSSILVRKPVTVIDSFLARYDWPSLFTQLKNNLNEGRKGAFSVSQAGYESDPISSRRLLISW